MVRWTLRKVRFKLRLTAEEAIAYLDVLNKDGMKRYGFRATEADVGMLKEVTQQHGAFVLCFIPHALLRGLEAGNPKRGVLVKRYIEQEKNIGVIPPIMVEGVHLTSLSLFDGHSRAGASYELGRPILGYIPEGLIASLPGVRPLSWHVRAKGFFGRH